MPRSRPGLAAAVLVVLTAAPARCVNPLDLLKYSPIHANSVVVINVDKILTSPRAVKEGWAKIEHTEYLAGAVPVNPHIERFVVVKEFNPHAPASGPVYAIAAVKQPVDVDRLVKLTGGTPTTVGDEPAVLTPDRSLLVPLDKQVLGVAWSDNRQDVTRDSLRGVPVQLGMIESKAYAAVYYRGGLAWSGRGRPGIFAVPVQESNLPTIRQQEAEVVQRETRAGVGTALRDSPCYFPPPGWRG